MSRGGVEVAAGGAAAEGGAGVQPAVCRGKQADQVVKAGGLGKVLLEKALADLKAAQPVHGAVAAPQGQQKQLYLLRGAGEAEPLRQRISLVQRGAAGGHPAVVVRELVGLEFHAPFAVGHHAVGLAHIGAAAVNGSTGAVLNVMPGDTVTLTADTTKFPENEEFGWWEITPYGSVSNTLTGQYQRTATFTMPNENVSARAMSKSAGVSTGGDIKAVQGTTGHASADMLVNTYAHIQQSSRVELGKKFESGFYAKPDTPSPQAVPAADEPTISMTALLELLKDADPEMKAKLRLALLT